MDTPYTLMTSRAPATIMTRMMTMMEGAQRGWGTSVAALMIMMRMMRMNDGDDDDDDE